MFFFEERVERLRKDYFFKQIDRWPGYFSLVGKYTKNTLFIVLYKIICPISRQVLFVNTTV